MTPHVFIFISLTFYYMARIKLGAFITSISGSVGGQSFQRNSSGMSMRTKASSCTGQSPAQLNQRSIMLAVQSAWRTLTDTQRSAWHFSTSFISAVSRRDNSVRLTGRELFIRWNILLMSAGYPINLSPDFNAEYTIDSDFTLYADDLSLVAVFDIDIVAANKDFLLTASRSAPSNYWPNKQSWKRIVPSYLGGSGYDLKDSFLSQHAVLPSVNDRITGSVHQFSTVSPVDSNNKRYTKQVRPISDLQPGLNWSVFSSPFGTRIATKVIRLSNGRLVGCWSNPNYVGYSDNGGLNWVASSSVLSGNLCDTLILLQSGRILLITQNPNDVYVSDNNAESWSYLYRITPSARCFGSSLVGISSVIVTATSPARLVISVDNAVSFSTFFAFTGETYPRSFVNLNDSIMLTAFNSTGNIWRSIDGGVNWVNVGKPLPITSLEGFCYLGNGIVLLGSANGSYLARSIDYGATWSSLGLIANDNIIRAFVNMGNGCVIAFTHNDSYVVRSFDYGATWSIVHTFLNNDGISSSVYIGNGSIVALSSVSGSIARSSIFPNA